MLRVSKIAFFALALNAVVLCLPDLSAASSSSTSRIAQRKNYREAQAPSKTIKPTQRLDLAEGEGQANSGKTPAQNNSANNSLQQRSQEDPNDRQEDRYIAQGETPRGYRYDGGQRHNDWDNQQDWQYYRKEFYSGKTQPEVYRERHPYGAGGIGYDPDPDYLRMQRIERDYYNRNRGNVR